MANAWSADDDQLPLPDSDDSVTSPNPEQERARTEYRERLAEKLKDPEFRKTEGFPSGTDEAVLALSCPPSYTACPNPFLDEWLVEHGTPYDSAIDNYHREPFAADVSEGKSDPIYNAHSYHTKVPHKAIMRYILHYTEPGDVVYDGFCGTGMTGVAAQMCGDRSQVEALGYTVHPDGTILDDDGQPFSKLGARKTVLNDLSPAASFIAHSYNTTVHAGTFERDARRILKEVERNLGWMYATLHNATPEEVRDIAAAVRGRESAEDLQALIEGLTQPGSGLSSTGSKMQVGRLNFIVWSDVFICPYCGSDVVFWAEAVEDGEVQDDLQCPSCRATLKKTDLQRATVTVVDGVVGEPVQKARRVPVAVNYAIGGTRCEKPADELDVALADAIGRLPVGHWYPRRRIDEDIDLWYERDYRCLGIYSVDALFQRRNLIMLAFCRDLIMRAEGSIRGYLWFWVESVLMGFSLLNRYLKNAFSQVNRILSGTLYVGALQSEVSPWYALSGKVRRLAAMARESRAPTIVCTGSAATRMPYPERVDYIFTDPPFGSNIIYSDLSIVWEAWLGVATNTASEAVVHRRKKSSASTLGDYGEMMTACFQAYFHALKPGRWMTVEFHNSANAVYNIIQEALSRAGFILADVRVLDKQQHSFKQVTTTSATKQDLVMSCYRPRSDFEARFQEVQGEASGVAEFLREHLRMLPVAPVNAAGKLEATAERSLSLLYDRMLTYHLRRGAPIPISASGFRTLLVEQFVERDGMYFLAEQAAKYDALRARGVEAEQLSIFVSDEKTGVQWIRGKLTEQPRTQGDLTPLFMQELREWDSHEPRPELHDLLREYFVEEHGVWRVPDPDSERDIEAMRRSALLRQFRGYVEARPPLKVFRKEAVLEGFRYCWETKQYAVIVSVCEKIPTKVLQEIHELVQFYDIARDLAPKAAEQLTFVWE